MEENLKYANQIKYCRNLEIMGLVSLGGGVTGRDD